MRFTSTLIALSSTALVAAQSNLVIEVGSTQDAPGGIFQFIPNNVTASNGTVVTFRFTGAPGNHTVTQSSFTDPCTPLSGGFDSGWVFIPPSNVSQAPEWNLTIENDSRPIWFYCKQLSPLTHCSAGMVGAINAPTSGSNTMEAFLGNARQFSGQSGQGVGALVGQGASASAPPGPLASGAQAFGVPGSSAAAGGGSSTGAPAPTTTTGSNGAIPLAGMSAIGTVLTGLGLAMGVVIA